MIGSASEKSNLTLTLPCASVTKEVLHIFLPLISTGLRAMSGLVYSSLLRTPLGSINGAPSSYSTYELSVIWCAAFLSNLNLSLIVAVISVVKSTLLLPVCVISCPFWKNTMLWPRTTGVLVTLSVAGGAALTYEGTLSPDKTNPIISMKLKKLPLYFFHIKFSSSHDSKSYYSDTDYRLLKLHLHKDLFFSKNT